MLDVIIAGAGPAGSVAGLMLARAGARVLMVDRETFPRDKLCGDTLNPGALAFLASIGLTGGPLDAGRPLAGMIVSGPHTSVSARYARGVAGRAILRRDLDRWLLDHAIAAGARFEPGLVVRGPLLDEEARRPWVRGLVLTPRGRSDHPVRMPATMTIAADGRRSVLGRALGLCDHPREPRRWAFGVYATGVAGMTDLGEMHIRPRFYLGIAPMTDQLVNVCVVTGARPMGSTPIEIVTSAIARDERLAPRFATAEFVSRVNVLGPLAVNARAAGVDGLLLAGDAAGFVDPMTGDGLHLAVQGARLAAARALDVLSSGDFAGAPIQLAGDRRAAFGAKLRFNRFVRAFINSRTAMEAAALSAFVAPQIVRRLVRYAGDAA